jgi:hypothetical protein
MNSEKPQETFSVHKGKEKKWEKNPPRMNFKINRCKHEKLQLRVNQTTKSEKLAFQIHLPPIQNLQ